MPISLHVDLRGSVLRACMHISASIVRLHARHHRYVACSAGSAEQEPRCSSHCFINTTRLVIVFISSYLPV
jgi:hypothetical protein